MNQLDLEQWTRVLLGNREMLSQLRAHRMSPGEIAKWLAYAAAQQYEEDGDEDMLLLRDAFLAGNGNDVIAALIAVDARQPLT